MESLAIFSVACNVMQAIQFGCEAINTYRRIQDERSPASELETNRDALHKVARDLKASFEAASADEKELHEVSAKVIAVTDKLQKELDKCNVRPGTSKRSTIGKALKYNLIGKRRMENLVCSLKDAERLMQTRILVDLRKMLGKNHAEMEQMLNHQGQAVRHFVQQLEAGHTQLEQLVLQRSDMIRDAIADHAERLKNDTRYDKLLQSLRYDEMNARRNAIEQPYEETFEWIFHEIEKSDNERVQLWPSFVDWLRSGKEIYWISGKAGSGKSTLMRFLIDSPRTKQLLQQQSPDYTILSAFIWNAGSAMQRSLKALVASLLHDMFCKNRALAMNLLEVETVSAKLSFGDWARADLENTLVEALQQHHNPICIFVDGLDEIDRAIPGSDGIRDLLTAVTRLLLPNVKICVSSRPEPLFEAALYKYLHLRVQDLTKQDIWTYVSSELEKVFRTGDCLFTDVRKDFLQDVADDSQNRPGLGFDANRVDDLAWTIVRKADGVFLWVRLVVFNIKSGSFNCDSWEMLIGRIEGLPSDIIGLYEAMWDRLMDDKKRYAQDAALYFNIVLDPMETDVIHPKFLTMLLCDEESIRRRLLGGGPALVEAEMLEHAQVFYRRLLSRCGGLLEVQVIQHQRGIQPRSIIYGDKLEQIDADLYVVFLHRSARDFLRDTKSGQKILGADTKTTTERRYLTVLARLSSSLLLGLARNSPLQNALFAMFDCLKIGEKALDEVCWKFVKLLEVTLERLPEWRDLSHTFIPLLSVFCGNTAYVKKALETRSTPPWSLSPMEWRGRLLGWTTFYQYLSVNRLGLGDLIRWLLEEGVNPHISSYVPGDPSACSPVVQALLGIQNHFCGELFTITDVPEMFSTLMEMLEHGTDVKRRVILGLGDFYHPLPFQSVAWFWQRMVQRMGHKQRYIVVLTELSIPHIFLGTHANLRHLAANASSAEWVEELLKSEHAESARPLLMVEVTRAGGEITTSICSKPITQQVDHDVLFRGSELAPPPTPTSPATANTLPTVSKDLSGKPSANQPQGKSKDLIRNHPSPPSSEIIDRIPQGHNESMERATDLDEGEVDNVSEEDGVPMIYTHHRLLKFFDDYAVEKLDGRGTLEWLVQQGLLHARVLRCKDPLEALVSRRDLSSDYRRGYRNMTELDCSPRPEYDEAMEALKEHADEIRSRQ